MPPLPCIVTFGAGRPTIKTRPKEKVSVLIAPVDNPERLSGRVSCCNDLRPPQPVKDASQTRGGDRLTPFLIRKQTRGRSSLSVAYYKRAVFWKEYFLRTSCSYYGTAYAQVASRVSAILRVVSGAAFIARVFPVSRQRCAAPARFFSQLVKHS